jgi:rubredoxin
MARRRFQQTVKLAPQVGFFDEYPILPDGIDPQVTMSRSDRQQPFFLICEKDTMLVQMTGYALIEFKESSVLRVNASPGDFIYVPARVPHRISPTSESIHYRYKAEHAGLEAAAWYCNQCGNQVKRFTWDTTDELPQEGYLRATTAFNESEDSRRCPKCGTLHPPTDVTGNNWQAVAAELRSKQDDDDAW